jgi:hypothetical protein
MPATVEAGPATIYVLHDLQELDLDPAAAGIRFQLPVTVARLDLAATPWNVTFVDVSDHE